MSREILYTRATEFNKRLVEMAGIDVNPADGDHNSETDTDIDFNQPFGAGVRDEVDDSDETPESRLTIDDANAEADADELFVSDDGDEIELPEEHGVSPALLNFTTATSRIPYKEAVYLAMRLLLEYELSEYTKLEEQYC